jgi:hypothetical protein
VGVIPGSKYAVIKALGKMPECVGHYEIGDRQCDGAPCTWRAGCQTYREHADRRARAYDVSLENFIAEEAAAMPHTVRTSLVIGLLRNKPADHPPRSPGHASGWDRFKTAFESTGHGVSLYAKRPMSRQGELFIHTWKRRGGGKPIDDVHVVKVKFPIPRDDVALLRYWLAIKSRVQPDVEIRAPVRAIFKASKYIEAAATRWRGAARQDWRSRIGARAVGVFAERIEDMGRLCGTLLRDGYMPGISASGGIVSVSEEAYTWQRSMR